MSVLMYYVNLSIDMICNAFISLYCTPSSPGAEFGLTPCIAFSTSWVVRNKIEFSKMLIFLEAILARKILSRKKNNFL
jgi:hypothetical protein